MVLFYTSINWDSVSILRFTFLRHAHDFWGGGGAMSRVCHLFYSGFFSVYSYVAIAVTGFSNSLSLLVLMISWSFKLMNLRNIQYWWVISFHFFFTLRVCRCHLSSVRLCASSWISSSLGPLAWIFHLSIFRKILSILRRRLPWC